MSASIRWNEMLKPRAPEGQASLAQRRGPQHARFWRDGVEGFSAGKSGTNDSSPGGTAQFSRTLMSPCGAQI